MYKPHKNGQQPMAHPSPTRSRGSKQSTPTHTPSPPPLAPWDRSIPVPTLPFPYAASAIFVVAVLCFCNSHAADFVFDDSEAILANTDLKSETPLGDLFQHDFWGSKLTSNTSHKSYRPLTVLTFRWNYYLANGLHPWGFHITNIALHGLVCIVFLLVFSVLFSGQLLDAEGHVTFAAPRASLLSGVLFAVHPVHTECVAGVVGRADLLCALIFLLSFICYVRACHIGGADKNLCPTSIRWPWLLLSMLMCGLSVLAKEQGITVLGICSAYDVIVLCQIDLLKLPSYLFPSGNKRTPKSSPSHRSPTHHPLQNGGPMCEQPSLIRGLVVRHLVLATTGVAILVGRWRVMGSVAPVFQVVDNPQSFAENIFLRAINYNYIYALNFWVLLDPWWLCFDWSMGCIPVITTLFDWRIVVPLMMWCVLVALIIRCFRGMLDRDRRVLIMSLALLVVPFLPATNLFFRVGFVIAERILYLSSAGFCMLVVVGIRSIATTYKTKQVLQVFIVFLIIFFMARSVQRSKEWRTEKQLFESGLQVCPHNAKVHYNIAKIYGDSGDVDYAINEYRLAISLHPEYDQAMNNLANILKERGDLQQAEVLLEKATSIRPEFAAAWMNLGIVQAALKKNASAEHSYHMALRHRRKYPDCYYNLGNLYLDMRQHQEALLAWRNATLLKPTHVSAWSNMILLLDNLGRISELDIVAKEAQRHLPKEPSIHYNIANALGKSGQFTESEAHFNRAIELDPNNPSFHSNIGVLYHRWGKLDKAEVAYQRALQLDPTSQTTYDNLVMLRRKMAKPTS